MSLVLAQSNQVLIGTVEFNQIITTIVDDVNQRLKDLVPQFRKLIRALMRRVVPVRTGKLLDTMLNNLRVDFNKDTLTISTILPSGYPVIIQNPAHTGQIGYGYGKYKPTNVIKNRVVIRETPKGAYYLLNDPTAEGNYLRILEQYALPVIKTETHRQLSQDYTVVIGLWSDDRFNIWNADRDRVGFSEVQDWILLLPEGSIVQPDGWVTVPEGTNQTGVPFPFATHTPEEALAWGPKSRNKRKARVFRRDYKGRFTTKITKLLDLDEDEE